MRRGEEGGPMEEIAVPQLRDETEWTLFLETKFIMAGVKSARGREARDGGRQRQRQVT